MYLGNITRRMKTRKLKLDSNVYLSLREISYDGKEFTNCVLREF